MFGSSKEYLNALRDGRYLSFLEWPFFLPGGADNLIDSLAYEWLSNGFCVEDAKKVALLSSLCNDETPLLQGFFEYYLNTMRSVVFMCLILVERQVDTQGKTKGQFINTMNEFCKQIDISACMEEQKSRYTNWIQEVSSADRQDIFRRLNPIVERIYWIREYRDCLEKESQTDPLRTTRLSLLNNLEWYLCEQKELTAESKVSIATRVAEIKEYNPADYEKTYLERLAPSTSWEKVLNSTFGLAISFFHLISKHPPEQGLTVNNDATLNLDRVNT